MSAGYHDVHLPEHPARREVWRVLADHLSRWVPLDAHVLEVGAGHCHWINAVRAARRVAVDTWPGLTQFAAPGVEARVMDASTELPAFPAGHFDVVLASNVLEHFEPDTASSVIGDMHTVLKPGGRLLIVQPNFRYAYRSYFDDYTHRSVFTDVSLPNLLRSRGFGIEMVEPKFLPYSMRDVHRTIPAWLVRAYLASPVKPRAGQMLVIATAA
jgi:SAM-dependent methyltransferase